MQMASADGQASGAGAAESAAADTEGPAGRLAAGRDVFRNASPGCQSCHSLQPGADMAGPTLAGIATRAAEILESPDYTGSAESVEGYIRESILEPSAYNVPGAMYSANGSSFMPGTYADSLSDTQVDQLAAWLATFE
jgi:nitric oxide reductase subunit C